MLKGCACYPYHTFRDGVCYHYMCYHYMCMLVCVTTTCTTEYCLTLSWLHRMKEGQKDIFYMAADSLDAASSAPFVERLVQRDYEVNTKMLSICPAVCAFTA